MVTPGVTAMAARGAVCVDWISSSCSCANLVGVGSISDEDRGERKEK